MLEILQEGETCVRKRRANKNIQQLLHRTWVADFMVRPEGRFDLGKFLSNKQFPWKRRRRMGMAVAGVTPTGIWLKKIGKLPTAGCRLCKQAREARGDSTQELPNDSE